MFNCHINGCEGIADREHIDACIEKYGFFIMSVFSTSDKPSFAYTIGMRNHCLPDIVVSGNMGKELQYALLSNTIRMLESNPKKSVGLTSEIANVPMILYPCDIYDTDLLENVVIQAEYYYSVTGLKSTNECPYIQLVWPDATNHFPDTLDCIDQELWLNPDDIIKYYPTLN